jgi:fatty acid-binding protein DegV
MHANNLEGADILRQHVDQRFDCTWLPTRTISLVLGAHTGPSLVAVAFAPQVDFTDVTSGI